MLEHSPQKVIPGETHERDFLPALRDIILEILKIKKDEFHFFFVTFLLKTLIQDWKMKRMKPWVNINLKKSVLILSENTSLVFKKCVFATNTDFLIFISLQPDVVIWTNRILGLTYLKPMALGCKDIGIRKSEFVAFWKRKEIK